MVYPWLKLTAKLYHEYDQIECKKSGIYYLLFSNKHSWLHRRTINVFVQLNDDNDDSFKKCCHINGTTTMLKELILHSNLKSHLNSTQ